MICLLSPPMPIGQAPELQAWPCSWPNLPHSVIPTVPAEHPPPPHWAEVLSATVSSRRVLSRTSALSSSVSLEVSIARLGSATNARTTATRRRHSAGCLLASRIRAPSRKVRRSRTTWALALCRSSFLREIACSRLRSVTRQWARAGLQNAKAPAIKLRTGRAFMVNSRDVIPTTGAGYSGDQPSSLSSVRRQSLELLRFGCELLTTVRLHSG